MGLASMPIPSFRLMRSFSKREWAEGFLSGCLYMNTLGYFWWQGNPEQRDILEGVCASEHPQNLTSFESAFRDAQAYMAKIIPAGYEYCNVCCFSMQRASAMRSNGGIAFKSPSFEMSLGDYYVVVDDPRALIARVSETARNLGYSVMMGPVEYCSEKPLRKTSHHITLVGDPVDYEVILPGKTPNLSSDAFCKLEHYSEQMEWRIALYRGVKDVKAFRLNVGDLHDVAHLVLKQDFDEDTKKCSLTPIPWLTPAGYVGTVSREELRDLLFRLGDGEVRLLVSVG